MQISECCSEIAQNQGVWSRLLHISNWLHISNCAASCSASLCATQKPLPN